jgi:hypothetical protein
MITFNPNVRSDAPAIRRRLEPGGGINSPSVAGWVLWDEPSTDREFEAIAAGLGLLASVPETAGKLAFVNLLPAAAHAAPEFARRYGRDKVSAYRAYLRRYLDLHRSRGEVAPYLSVDSYPFQLGSSARDHFLTLREMALAAREYSRREQVVRTWLIVQLSPFRAGGRTHPAPDAVRIRWQVSAALAYGATGIWYWTLAPATRGDYLDGLVDARGRETSAAKVVRETNARLRTLGPEFMRLEWLATRHQRRGPDEGIVSDSWDTGAPGGPAVRRLLEGGDDGMVGVFRHRDRGDTCLWVANKSLSATRTFRVELEATAREVVLVGDGTSTSRVLARGTRTFPTPRIPPGQGILLRIVR